VLPDLLDSLLRPAAYRRFSGEAASRSAGYVAFLSIIFVGALCITLKLRLAPVIDETFGWFETSMPSLKIAGGQVTSAAPGPVRLEHPDFKEVAIMIDTSRKEPVTSQMMADMKVKAVLSSNALYVEHDDKVEVFDLSKSADERPLVVDAQTYRSMHRTFNVVFYPAMMLVLFLLFALTLALFGLAYGVVGLIASSLTGAKLGFGALFRIALHAQTAAALLRAIDTLLPTGIPFLLLLSPAASLVYLWLGVRAARANGAAPAA
jgi:hypothetical protein